MNPTTGVPADPTDTALFQALWSSTVPLEPAPATDDPSWIRVDELLHPRTWERLGRDYSRALGTPHLAPGQVCSLQHYAGRAVQAPVLAWCADGSLLDLTHERWWARIDHTAATHAVACPRPAGTGRDTDPHPLAELLSAHLDPVIDAATAAGPATRRVALGCVAASVAGALALAHRCVEPARRDAVASAARTVTARLHGGGRPTVTMIDIGTPAGERLAHDRHTCCLIRLGAEGRTCASCPRLPEADRRRRQLEHATEATAPVRLPLAASA